MNQSRRPGDAGPRQLGARLARDLSDAFVLFHEAVGTWRGLSPGDHKALSVIERSGPLTASELARKTGLTAGAVTGLVDRLVDGGYVRREPYPSDGRRVLVSVVESPDDPVLSDAVATLERESGSLVENFDEHERAAVVRWITAMTERLHNQSRRLGK